MRLLICGGRDYGGKGIAEAISEIKPSLVITGGARGADYWGTHFAHEAGVACVVYPANWKGDGKAAGPIRNSRMLKDGRPDMVLACPGGRGTADMVAKARKAGVRVRFLSTKGDEE